MRSILFSCALVVGCGVTDESTGVTIGALDGTIRVTAYHWASEVPFAGTEVQFIAPDQSVQTVVTDADGVAEAVSPPNTRVVVFQDGERTGSPLVRVFEAAGPGDHIIAGRRAPMAFAELGTVRFSMPPRIGWNHPQGIVYYALHISCSPDNGVWLEPARDMRVVDCAHATNATAVGWVEDGSGVLLTGPSVLRNLDLTAHVGETIRMPAYEPKLATATGQFVNTPPGTRLLWQTESYYGDDPTLFAYGSTFDAQPDVVNTRPSLGVGDRTLSSVQFFSSFYTNVYHLRADAGFAASYVLDADASHRMQHVTFADFSAYSQTVTWHPASDGLPASMVYVYLTIFTPDGRLYRIELYTPGDATSVTLPALPPSVTPQLNDAVFKSAVFYRVSNETYSQWLQAHSSRDPFRVITWSSEMPREVWLGF
jgi:hypothetical protein